MESTDNAPKPRREKPTRSRKKSREEELAEYEEEYMSRSKKTQKSKPPKHDTDDDTARYRRSMERPMGWKSESTTLLLSIILGLFGLSGIGHLYLGMIGRGVVILIGGIALMVAGVATVMFVVGWFLLIAYIPLFIWQIIDSRKMCRLYNDYYEEFGKEPNW